MFQSKLPELSHIEKPEAGLPPVYVTTEGIRGILYRLPPIDTEGPGFQDRFLEMTSFVERLKPGIRVRFLMRVTPKKHGDHATFRKVAIENIGWLENEVFVFFEEEARQHSLFQFFKGKKAASEQFAMAFDVEAFRRLGALPISESEIPSFFPCQNSEIVRSGSSIETGTEHIAVLRIWRQGVALLERDSLAILRESLVPPYEIVVNLRKMNDVKAQYILQRKRSQLGASTDPLSAKGYEKAQEAVEETVLSGRGMVEMEWLLLLRRKSEETLKEDMEQAERVLKNLGDLTVEVAGILPSFRAACPGGTIHHSFMELDGIAPYYLPVFVRGAERESVVPVRALPLHRRDGSLYHFDLFRKGYDGGSCLINGRRGKGKSVLANLISSALLEDPTVRLVKVDVGGSYVKECELTGGTHTQFNLTEPSGLNPFALITDTQFREDAAAIMAGFLSTLLLEAREIVLTKEMQGAVERSVLSYMEEAPSSPTMTDFLHHAKDLPRRGLLERFSAGGVYANVLQSRQDQAELFQNRYVYFNFERLQNAANEDFAQAVMAAVIATVNLEVLRAGDARRGNASRVVFFADETPFFIQRNGRFFKLTTANFRKFGHGTVLIAQTTRDFELPKEDGTTDYGILINSPIRFFYQVDDEAEVFRERFGLTSTQLSEIQSLERSESWREVFLQDELGGRVLRVEVTPEEYWRVTSSRNDNEKIQSLMKAVPGLLLKEAIRCLSV